MLGACPFKVIWLFILLGCWPMDIHLSITIHPSMDKTFGNSALVDNTNGSHKTWGPTSHILNESSLLGWRWKSPRSSTNGKVGDKQGRTKTNKSSHILPSSESEGWEEFKISKFLSGRKRRRVCSSEAAREPPSLLFLIELLLSPSCNAKVSSIWISLETLYPLMWSECQVSLHQSMVFSVKTPAL